MLLLTFLFLYSTLKPVPPPVQKPSAFRVFTPRKDYKLLPGEKIISFVCGLQQDNKRACFVVVLR